jgi:hypothetical protein
MQRSAKMDSCTNRIKLNTTKSPRDRYFLLLEGDEWTVVSGVNRGNGYQAYYTLSYFVICNYVPEEIKEKVRSFLGGKA